MIESVERAQIPACDISSVDQKRHVFAGMVGGRRCRIAAVISGQDQNIVAAHSAFDSRQMPVLLFDSPRISLRIVEVTVKHIGVDEIDENEPSLGFSHEAERLFDPLSVVARVR